MYYPILSFKNCYKTVISSIQPDWPALWIFLNRATLAWLAKAVKLNAFYWNSSSCVWVARTEAMILPALLPQITLGKQSAYINAWITPIWYIPIIAPPLSKRALLPTACLTYAKNYSFLFREISDLSIVSMPLASYYWYCSMSLLDLL